MFSPLWIVTLGLPADPLHLLDLSRLAGRLNVLEVHLKPSDGLMPGIHSPSQIKGDGSKSTFERRILKNGSYFENFLRNFKTTSHVVNNMHR
jgi:hypothetical protein